MKKINSSMLFNVGVKVNSISNGISVQGKETFPGYCDFKSSCVDHSEVITKV